MVAQDYQRKVAIVNSRPSRGGAATIAASLYHELKKENILVEFIFDQNSSLKHKFSRIQEKLTNFLSKKKRGVLWSNNKIGSFSGSDILNRFDLIHLHWINDNFLSLSELKDLNKPLVWTLHDLWPLTGGCHIPIDCEKYSEQCGECPHIDGASEIDLSRSNFLNKQNSLSNKNIHWVAPSNFVRERALLSPFVTQDNISVIHNGIDFSLYESLSIKEDTERPALLFGALDWHVDQNKGAQFLEECLWKLSEKGMEFDLRVFGSPVNSTFSNRISYENLGPVSKGDLPKVFNSSDLFLFPSKFETFGLMSIEAQLSGAPVVAFNSHGAKDTIEHQATGYLSNFEDEQDFIKGIEFCLENRVSLATKAQHFVKENFSVKVMSDKYIDLYKKLNIS